MARDNLRLTGFRRTLFCHTSICSRQAASFRKSDDRKVGFLWLCAVLDLAGRPCTEIRIINITKSMRGKGCGTRLLSIALDEYRSHIVTAKCYPGSVQMSGMLKRRGFEVMGTSERGSEFLCLEPE
ncbi:GNAT family N-acetyltransferase [Erwinia persicina]|uniref:GNAT family N-acetyltransferase n=1 Tax=Erwinia persicina TaxID=55211 RepID=A0A4U3EN88_9GAMM|nr:GNAT family N-acetyltransferase [Erwinia persicina]MBD8170329.1 GNAT family N-acetyltransferase [Erwinia persicina]MBD8212551.1 GNAT family N-acetyltransferase [Erwinia persicina]TKJ81813.1 hypothetical protein EpCFBP13511_24100 [Erwinia persicina]